MRGRFLRRRVPGLEDVAQSPRAGRSARMFPDVRPVGRARRCIRVRLHAGNRGQDARGNREILLEENRHPAVATDRRRSIDGDVQDARAVHAGGSRPVGKRGGGANLLLRLLLTHIGFTAVRRLRLIEIRFSPRSTEIRTTVDGFIGSQKLKTSLGTILNTFIPV